MNINLVLEELKDYLSNDQWVLFKLYYEGYGMNDIIKIAGVKRNDVFDKLVDLGRALARFEVFRCIIVPDIGEPNYVAIFNTCLNKIKEETENGEMFKSRNARKKKKT